MSANPIAFDELRRHGYRWMQRNAPNAKVLYRHMETQLAFWRAENPGLSAELGVAEGHSVIFSITRWCTDNYKCVRPPRNTKERRDRRASRIVTGIGDLRRAGRRPSCRKVALWSGTSRMTVHRFLVEDRRRREEQEKRDALSPKAKAMLGLIEQKVAAGRPVLFNLDQLATVLVSGETSDTPSARSMRRKRIEEAVSALSGFGISFRRKRGLIAIARDAQPTDAEWNHALLMTPQPVCVDEVPPGIIHKGLFTSDEAVDIMTLSKVLNIRSGSMSDVMRIAVLSKAHDFTSVFRTLWKAHHLQVDIPKYVRAAPRYLRLTPDDARAFASFADFLKDMGFFLTRDACGDDIEFILGKHGYRRLMDDKGRRRLDFVLFLLRMDGGVSNLYNMAELERRRLWRFDPRKTDIKNFPSREFLLAHGHEGLAAEWDDLDAPSPAQVVQTPPAPRVRRAPFGSLPAIS